MKTRKLSPDGRRRPSCYYCGHGGYCGRSITLSTGRGDTRITPAEARELAEELLAEAKKAEELCTITMRS